MYKCVVSNKFGEINANLSLNIEIAPVIRERPIIKKVEKKKSVVLQCAVQGSQDIDVQCTQLVTKAEQMARSTNFAADDIKMTIGNLSKGYTTSQPRRTQQPQGEVIAPNLSGVVTRRKVEEALQGGKGEAGQEGSSKGNSRSNTPGLVHNIKTEENGER